MLRARYELGRGQIAEGFEAVCGQEGVTVHSAQAVAAALRAYRNAGDFADLIHHALAAEAGAEEFVTFDRSFGKASIGPALTIL